MVQVIAAVVVAYLLGALPIANTVARLGGVVDLRDVGDRNPGFWNARANLRPRLAALVFLGDTAKGVGAVIVAQQASTDWRIHYLAGAAAMIGHAWPATATFRGGRSVLTWVGATLVLSPWPAVFCIAILLLWWMSTQMFAYSVRVAIVVFPFIQLYRDGQWRTAASGALMTLIGLRFLLAWRADRARN
jgi:glycerol-3-phosphate acyltransferase PlsY